MRTRKFLFSALVVWFSYLLSGIAFAVSPAGLPVDPQAITVNDLVLKYSISQPNTYVEIPLWGTVDNISIDWGDGSTTGPISTAGHQPHTFIAAGDFTVVVSGTSLGTYGAYGFAGAAFLTEVVQWGNLGITSLEMAFLGATELVAVPSDLPSTVTNLSYTFSSATKFNDDISAWNTANVTNMSGMFSNSYVFNQNIGGWNTSKVTRMDGMFQNALKFNQDISQWNTASVTNMGDMFGGALEFNNGSATDDELHPLRTVGDKWNVSNVTTFTRMFSRAFAFNQDIGNWNVSGAPTLAEMFRETSKFNQDISAWNPTSAYSFAFMFLGATAFNNGDSPWIHDATHWNIPLVYELAYMFADTRAFNQDISNWNTTSVTNTAAMFAGATAYNNGELPLAAKTDGWDVSNLVDASSMFAGASAFNQPLTDWSTPKLAHMQNMFTGATVFNQPLNHLDVDLATNFSQLFSGAEAFNQDLHLWNVSNVTNFGGLFWNAKKFNGNISTWNTSNVTNMSNAFEGASEFNNNISSWDTSQVSLFYNMFTNAAKFNQPIGSWNVSSGIYGWNMFRNAVSFDQNLGAWDTSGFYDLGDFLYGVKLSKANYDSLLVGWADNLNRNNVNFSGGLSQYTSNAVAARAKLTGAIPTGFAWNLSDGGLGKLEPTITTPPTASTISYGQSLSDSTLSGGVASVAGTFSFTSPNESPAIGTLEAAVTFTPEDTTTYDSVSLFVSVTVEKGANVLTWDQATDALTSKTYSDTFSIKATSSAGLSVAYSVSGGCSISGTSVTMTSGTNSCVVSATQAGDEFYSSATTITKTISANKAVQSPLLMSGSSTSITFNSETAATVALNLSGGSGLGALTIEVADSTVCSVAEVATIWTVTAKGAGECLVTAAKAADDNYQAMTSSELKITIAQATPSISIDTTKRELVFGAAFTGPLIETNSDGDVVYSSSNTAVATVDAAGEVTIVGVGSTTISAYVESSTNYSKSAEVSYIIDVSPKSQNLSWDLATTQRSSANFEDSFTVSATSSENLTVMLTATGGCTLSGSTVTMTSGSTACVLTASQIGTSTVSAATEISHTINAVKKAPTFTFEDLSTTITWGDSFRGGSANSNSDGSISYTSTDTSVATVNANGVVTVLRAGSFTITASLAASADYTAATALGYNVIVEKARQQLSWSDAVSALVSVTFGEKFDVAATSTQNLVPQISASGGCAINRGTVEMVSGTTPCVLRATQTGSDSVLAADEIEIRIAANKAIRTLDVTSAPGDAIKFDASGIRIGAQPTAGTGTPNFTVVGTSVDVCSVDSRSGELGIVRAGRCDILIQLEATADFSAAEQRVSFDITPIAATSPENVTTIVEADQLLVSWTPPMSLGGADLLRYQVTAAANGQTFSCEVPATESQCVIVGFPTEISSYTVQVIAVTGFPFGNGSEIPGIAAAYNGVVDAPQIEETQPPTEDIVIDERGLEVVDWVEDQPLKVAETTVDAITLISAVTAAAGAAAAAAGVASAGAATAGSSGSSSSSASRSTDSRTQRETDDGGLMRDISEGKIDAVTYETDSIKWGDTLPIWQMGAFTRFDRPLFNIAARIAHLTPIISKAIVDGGYLRAMMGSLAALIPAFAATLGLVAVQQAEGVMVPPTTVVMAALIVLGILDVLAGFIAGFIIVAGLAISAGISTIADVRLLFGVVAALVAPSLAANAFRSLRRDAAVNSHDWWERVVDLFVSPFIGGWLVFALFETLPALGGAQFGIASDAAALGLIAAFAVALRVIFEEFAAQIFPGRMHAVHPHEVRNPGTAQRLLVIIARALLFAFISQALVGDGWHLYVGAFLFVLPGLIGLFEHHLPNSPRLYQILPAGLQSVLFTMLAGLVILSFLVNRFGESSELIPWAFVILPLPSVVVSVMKSFGRHPKPDDVRWYMRTRYTWLYRSGGVVVLMATVYYSLFG